ncbi:C39 family peptidase [Paenibacillus hemerocallicola]|uniref:C39 family peptidase n=1 Tax=Paenibacillus hemerocallicola TaxID=1172614 RepID=UPI00159EBCAF|nr:C39 family peptidase [Paenibacillus hemerocallicola]
MKKITIALAVAGGLIAVTVCIAAIPHSAAHTWTGQESGKPQLVAEASAIPGGTPEASESESIEGRTGAWEPQAEVINVALATLPSSAMIEVPVIDQLPELFNGCEVTSLAMLLEAAGSPVDKMELAERVAKDRTPLVRNEDGAIESWGNPDVGFVGDMTGETDGYGVYHGPIFQLLAEILPRRAADLTELPFDELLTAVADGRPVVIWTNINFTPETLMETWQSDAGPVQMSWYEHAVLLVGYDDEYMYVNDPFDGAAAKPIERDTLISSWLQMGSQAVTYRK